ncbi:uncharacterized oxidoreductase SERP2049-like [Clytia hemisphaerica]|uniref:uncharacterized oxidoreductase SERP2049-like n=1 Tax=Clytia hemisphaerica TaxID=252671 RepID=UPI0034D60A5C|eukprot:TCONS_00001650-protein
MKTWAIITGAGTGIGAALVKELSKLNSFSILALGRRIAPLEKTKSECENKDQVTVISADISKNDDLQKIKSIISPEDNVKFLVQNAAVGLPDKLMDIKREDFEYALAVNVTAPLLLSQMFLPQLSKCKGRIIHIGTGVAFNPQVGTSTYGITKMAFHRLYTQLQVELKGTGAQIAMVLPGVVDTEGLWDHYDLAKKQELPHTAYFDQVKREGKILSSEASAKFLKYVMCDTSEEDFPKEWNANNESLWSLWKN